MPHYEYYLKYYLNCGRIIRDEEVPLIENIDAAILVKLIENMKLKTNGLDMDVWHGGYIIDGVPLNETNWCKTTHCRAGYIVCMAGAAGFNLETKAGSTARAASLILLKSGVDVPDFHADTDDALLDIIHKAKEQGFTPSDEDLKALFEHYGIDEDFAREQLRL